MLAWSMLLDCFGTRHGMNQAPVQAMRVVRRTMTVSSEQHIEALDITAEIQRHVTMAEVVDGMLVANCLHTTCCLLVADLHSSLIEHLRMLLEALVPDGRRYEHNDPRYSDCERGNAAAHLRACLLNQTVAIGVEHAHLSLGEQQSIVFVEWDGPRSRHIDLQIMGTSGER